MFPFHVISGAAARRIVSASRADIIEQVRRTYLRHHDGETINPNSYFLRFPQRPNARIIALPAYLGGEQEVAGIKWISSFPDNVARNVPRASAALLLNDMATGYPFACLEASQISAARTAASAAVAATALQGGASAGRVAVIGAGVISRNIVDFLFAAGWEVGEYRVFDRIAEYGERLTGYIGTLGAEATLAPSLEACVEGAELVVFATTAAEPYVTAPDAFAAGQNVLNISLRDLGPELVAESHNLVDDIDHCLTANTSPHLAEQKYGHRDFIDGTLAELLRGDVTLTADKPRIFSPFGLGVLDLAVGMHVYQEALRSEEAVEIPGFFGETERWEQENQKI
ncbi:2,3-diaminopropionate biosynthesis protein SbnB [Streptomyces solicathayae]|uniref:2,3-diaminopropionate biosynthesis protein SbnB n=1 Tax=Streptomyces solicathayae TaxID=3081768 RepID=A0ABZ0M2S7_9ACTN|nr:2,3-diaminopropionate biosynthesis protein SbnB [Streptomyces sp. HUAS YS2]WOX25999.1 2,3-diaminopropionate biosynthesis protein SbnB [Streptomyces sp. HUAS YS2]